MRFLRRALLFLFIFIVLAMLVIIIWPEKKYAPYEVSAQLKARAESYYIHPMPEGWQWQTHRAIDGVVLRWGQGPAVEAAKARIVVLPGFTGTLEQYGEHLTRLQAMGYEVAGLDLRGQGGSQRLLKNPEKPWVDDFSTYVQDVADFLNTRFKRSDKPLILWGTSFGGHVAYRVAGEHQTQTDGLFLIAPAFRPHTSPFSYKTAKWLVNGARWLGKSKFYAPGQDNWFPWDPTFSKPDYCGSYPKRLYIRDAMFVRQPELRVGTATNQWLAELMESGEYVQEPDYAQQIRVPVQMVLATADELIVTEVAEQVCTNTPGCVSERIPRTQHCLQLERDAVLEDIYAAMESLAGRIPSGL